MRKPRRMIPITPRTLMSVLVLLALSFGGWCSLASMRIYRENIRELGSALHPWSLGDRERVLVIAPHCDDEALGCAGVIHDVLKAGGQVRVVLVTNGDGSGELIRRLERVGPRGFIDLGVRRLEESHAAMRAVGLPDRDIISLGYPDRGISGMWLENWTPSVLYKSHYTKCDHSPYKDSFRPGAPYCGESLLADLESIILSFRPTTVYCPHPLDEHSDHWAVNCFVTQALHELNVAEDVRMALYIVHSGKWPVPDGAHPTKALAPPAFMDKIGMSWYSYPLSDEHVSRKLQAIRSYRTQTIYMGDYLCSFGRRNELFAEYRPSVIPCVTRPPYGDEERFWERILPCVLDPVEDSIRVDLGRSGDIKAIKACYDDRNLYVRVELAHVHSRRLRYGVQVFGLPDATSGRVKVFLTAQRTNPKTISGKLSGDTVDVTIPLHRLGNWKALMICADTSLGHRRVDRSAWRVLTRAEGDATPLPNLPAGHQGHRTPLSPARRSP